MRWLQRERGGRAVFPGQPSPGHVERLLVSWGGLQHLLPQGWKEQRRRQQVPGCAVCTFQLLAPSAPARCLPGATRPAKHSSRRQRTASKILT